MIQSQLVILHQVERNAEAPGALCVSFEQFKDWVRTGKIIIRFLRYQKVTCRTYRLEVIPKPFLFSLLIRLLSHDGCAWVDEEGKSREVGLGFLAHLFKNLVLDLIRKKSVLRMAWQKTRELGLLGKKTFGLDLRNQPLYLRSDLNFGLRSGGSVGHIAGVLNQLDSFTGKPIFITSDRIPTVRPELETHIVFPTGEFSDFKELPSLHYNQTFTAEASRLLRGRKPSFIYQRYSLNNHSGLELSKKFQVPLVLEYNGSEIWVGRNWGTPLKYEKIAEENEVLNLKGCDLVVVVSRPLEDELRKRGVDPKKILVNPNGVDPQKYSPDTDGSEVKRNLGLAEKTVLGFIGSFGRWHGAEILAEAFGKLLAENPDYRGKIRLMMIGEGVTMPLVRQKLAQAGVQDQAILTGSIPQEKGPAYLAACDILVAPHVPNPDGSPFFGSPTKLFEYMAMGKGIVASDLDQIGQILKQGETAWMVKPGDSDSLKEGLKKMIEDAKLRKSLGVSARREVLAKYTWKEHTGRIIEKLKQVCL